MLSKIGVRIETSPLPLGVPVFVCADEDGEFGVWHCVGAVGCSAGLRSERPSVRWTFGLTEGQRVCSDHLYKRSTCLHSMKCIAVCMRIEQSSPGWQHWELIVVRDRVGIRVLWCAESDACGWMDHLCSRGVGWPTASGENMWWPRGSHLTQHSFRIITKNRMLSHTES